MPAVYVAQQIVNGLTWGGMLGLMAVGYTLLYGVVGLINFAQGEIFMVGAFTVYLVVTLGGAPFWVGLIAGVLMSVLVGVLTERVAFRPVRKSGGLGGVTLFITSLAVSMVLKNLFIMVFTQKIRPFPRPAWLLEPHLLEGVFIRNCTLIILGITALVAALLWLFVKHTKIGVAMRAVAYERETAELMGIDINKIIVIAFVISSSLAALAGISWGIQYATIQPTMGFVPVVDAFVASVLGGVGNIFGALLGGIIIGVGEILFVSFLPTEFIGLRPVFVWVVLFVLLIFRPTGLFPTTTATRA